MVLRRRDRRLATLVAACCAAASLAARADAQTGKALYAQSFGSGQMVWGGRLPERGEEYVPSVPGPVVDGTARSMPQAAGRMGTRRSEGGDLSQESLPRKSQGTQPFQAGSIAEAGPPTDLDRLLGDLVGGGVAPAAGLPAAAEPSVRRNDAAPSFRSAPTTDRSRRKADPWTGLKQASGKRAPADQAGQVASLGLPERKPDLSSREIENRGALKPETPSGYAALPKREAMCRTALRRMGVRFTDIAPIRKSKSCGIPYPVKVTWIADGIAMKPPATLNCDAVYRISRWVEDEVEPAARWRLWKRPTAVLNASSYRCSRIAGSRTVSEHATGNALDIRGFQFADGSVIDVEKKGFFSFREKGFQKSIRRSACEHFGTVLGPGYNYDHRDHFHLDAKNRRKVVCK